MDNLSSYLLDLLQNSIQAKATRIELSIHETDILEIIIKDNGFGMTKDELNQAASPFYTTRTTRRVGLGLSMIKLLTEQTEGSFKLTSTKGKGTELNLVFNHHHIDMPDFGDLGEMIYMVSIHQDVNDFIFNYQYQQESYAYSLKEVKEVLGSAIQTYSVMQGLIKSINNEIEMIRGTK
jgi:hypothetical protein